MVDIWLAAGVGNVGEVEWLVGQDPGLLDARDSNRMTPLMWASRGGHVGVVRWLVDQGAAINERNSGGCTALLYACHGGCLPVVELLLERGADTTIALHIDGTTSLMIASSQGHLEVVRVLLGHPSARATISHRSTYYGTGGGPATTAMGVWRGRC
jgi:ankyrin repeat protein